MLVAKSITITNSKEEHFTMKKRISLALVVLMMLSVVGVGAAASRYDVTEPITIQWWHAHRSMA